MYIVRILVGKCIEAKQSLVPPVPGNIAYGVRTCASSHEGKHMSYKAVDGDASTDPRDGSCSITLNEKNPWWVGDLKASHKIAHIQLSNRKDECCSKNIYILSLSNIRRKIVHFFWNSLFVRHANTLFQYTCI